MFGNSVESIDELEESIEPRKLQIGGEKHALSYRFNNKGGGNKYTQLHRRSASLGQKIKAVPKEALNSENRINRLKMMSTTLRLNFDSN